MLLERILKQNPWWGKKEVEGIKNYKERFLFKEVSGYLKKPQIIAVVGLRRTGKTVILLQTIQKLLKRKIAPKRILYFSFDEILGKDPQIIEKVLGIYENEIRREELKDVFVFFDEVNHLKNWQVILKRYYDLKRKIKFFVSGSSSIYLHKTKESLAGRIYEFELTPLSFKEFLRFKGIDIDIYHAKTRAKIFHSFESFLIEGGFPELVRFTEKSMKNRILQEYFNVMLYRDLVERYQIRDPSILKYLLKRIIASFTKEFSVNRIYNDLKSRGFKIGKNSIYRLIEQIFSIYLAASVEKYDPAVVKREMSNKKIYLYDNGMASAMHYAFSEDRGRLLENLVFSRLRSLSQEIYFLKNGYECDFAVFPLGQKPLLVQVTDTLHQDNLKREIKGFAKARKRLDQARCLLIAADISISKEMIPEWLETYIAADWFLAGRV